MFKKIIIVVIVLLSLGVMAFKDALETTKEPLVVTDGYAPIVVLELFTSQGCSSCPPADVLLNKIKKEYPSEVFALSYHVDYWNYIGWKDPFSKPVYSQKQNFYNSKFNNSTNYTPQLIVNGKEHFVGSSTSKMYAKVNAYKNIKAENRIEISNIIIANKKVQFDYNILGDFTDKQLKIVLVLEERTTQIDRGENRNRTLKNSNIVVAEKGKLIDKQKGKAGITIPTIVTKNEAIKLMVLIENNTNDITGATKVALER